MVTNTESIVVDNTTDNDCKDLETNNHIDIDDNH